MSGSGWTGRGEGANNTYLERECGRSRSQAMQGLSNHHSCSRQAACLYVVDCIQAALIVGVDVGPCMVCQDDPLDGGVHSQEGGEGGWGDAWVSRSCWCNFHLQESDGRMVDCQNTFKGLLTLF